LCVEVPFNDCLQCFVSGPIGATWKEDMQIVMVDYQPDGIFKSISNVDHSDSL